MISPDNNAAGFLDQAPDALRYEYASKEPDDTAMRIAKRIPLGSRVLDVGCGTGSITEIIRNTSNATIIGLEPDEQRARQAQSRGLTVINDYLSVNLIRDQGPFDFVVFADVIEHLPNPAQVISLAKTALKPGGSILASVPNVAHFYTRLDLLCGVFRYEDCGIMDATHLRWFTKGSFKLFFERLDFEVVYQDYTVMPTMHYYSRRKPFCWMNERRRTQLLRRLAAWKPEVFSVQHIIQAAKARV
jgi:methionine biosynthesis protein MetW